MKIRGGYYTSNGSTDSKEHRMQLTQSKNVQTYPQEKTRKVKNHHEEYEYPNLRKSGGKRGRQATKGETGEKRTLSIEETYALENISFAGNPEKPARTTKEPYRTTGSVVENLRYTKAEQAEGSRREVQPDRRLTHGGLGLRVRRVTEHSGPAREEPSCAQETQGL